LRYRQKWETENPFREKHAHKVKIMIISLIDLQLRWAEISLPKHGGVGVVVGRREGPSSHA
jgi:hypothetical protein